MNNAIDTKNTLSAREEAKLLMAGIEQVEASPEVQLDKTLERCMTTSELAEILGVEKVEAHGFIQCLVKLGACKLAGKLSHNGRRGKPHNLYSFTLDSVDLSNLR